MKNRIKGSAAVKEQEQVSNVMHTALIKKNDELLSKIKIKIK